MIGLTIEQAKLALEIIENDIFLSDASECDFNSVDELTFYLNRAELRQRLKTAIANLEGAGK